MVEWTQHGLDRMHEYKAKSDIKHGVAPSDVDMDFTGRFTVGKFVDIEKPTLNDTIDQSMLTALGGNYHKIDVTQTVQAQRRNLRDTDG